MGDFVEFRAWEELIPDALGLIFRNLSLHEILTVVPRVCRSWSRAVAGPYCWQEIDIQEWSRLVEPDKIDRMLRLLIRWSGGSFRRLSVSGLPNDSLFSFIADHAASLKSLELPRSAMSDAIVEQVVVRLSNITFLDISSCEKIGARALEAFGKHCKSLVGLRRSMHPLEVAGKVCQDDEALAVALTMPKLHHLELAYLLITTQGVIEILSGCPKLEFLDIRGCWDVKLEEEFMKEKHGSLKVLGPKIIDSYDSRFYDMSSDPWDVYSDYSDSDMSVYSWEFMDDGDGVYQDMSDDMSDEGDDVDEMSWVGFHGRFYGAGFNEALGFEWPESP